MKRFFLVVAVVSAAGIALAVDTADAPVAADEEVVTIQEACADDETAWARADVVVCAKSCAQDADCPGYETGDERCRLITSSSSEVVFIDAELGAIHQEEYDAEAAELEATYGEPVDGMVEVVPDDPQRLVGGNSSDGCPIECENGDNVIEFRLTDSAVFACEDPSGAIRRAVEMYNRVTTEIPVSDGHGHGVGHWKTDPHYREGADPFGRRSHGVLTRGSAV